MECGLVRKRRGSDTIIGDWRVVNPSAWGHLNPSSYCDVGRLFYGVFKIWSKLQRKNEEIISRNSLPHYKRASSFTNKREAA